MGTRQHELADADHPDGKVVAERTVADSGVAERRVAERGVAEP